MHIAIVIGSYRLADYVRLNIRACRRIIGDADILVSDDHSQNSDSIAKVCDEEDVAFMTSDRRRSHCSGDWQSYINGEIFGLDCRADIVLKLSQRLVPARPEFRAMVEDPFADPKVRVVIPAAMDIKTAARPDTRFYHRFPALTDVVAWRVGVFPPEYLMNVYRDQCAKAVDKATQHLQLTEHGWLRICNECPEGTVVRSDALANPPPFKPKAYLRKAQCTRLDYLQLAKAHGVDGLFDIREWVRIEPGDQYLCRPPVT